MSGVGRGVFVSGMLLVLFSLPLFSADTPAAGPNSDPTYQQLRNIALGGEAVAVNNFALKREAATFHLRSGTVCFLAPVQGKVTGAVFVGDGNFVIEPPSASEQSMLKLLTKEDEFSENFSQAVFRFTDSTYDELKKTGSAALRRLRCRFAEGQPECYAAQSRAQIQPGSPHSRRRAQFRARRALCSLRAWQALQRQGTLHD